MPHLLQYKGIDISVDENGKFIADVDGAAEYKFLLIELTNLLDAEIAARAKTITVSLPVTGIVQEGSTFSANYTVASGIVTGINRNTGKLTISGTAAWREWIYAVPDSEENRQLMAEFAELLQRESELRRKVAAISIGIDRAYARILATNYAGKIADLEQEYNKKTQLKQAVAAH